MVTKEDINKLAATLSEITKTLHNVTALANGMVEDIGKLREKFSTQPSEKEKLLAEIEKLREELLKKIDSLKHSTNAEITLSSDKQETASTPIKKDFPGTVKKPITKPSDATTLVDQFKAKTSINDTITKSEPAIAIRQPIHDIAKAIAINDRFLFIRELFEGDSALFAQTVNKLNAMSNLEDAKEYIQTVVKNWDDTSEPAQLFLSIVQRRYL